MARKTEVKKDAASFWLVATFVVAATVGSMVWISSGDDDKAANDKVNETEQEVLEVQPLVPRGKIKDASWNEKDAAADPDADEFESGKSMLDGDMDPFKDTEKATKAEENLKKTVDKIHGLGVYVAPAEKDD